MQLGALPCQLACPPPLGARVPCPAQAAADGWAARPCKCPLGGRQVPRPWNSCTTLCPKAPGSCLLPAPRPPPPTPPDTPNRQPQPHTRARMNASTQAPTCERARARTGRVHTPPLRPPTTPPTHPPAASAWAQQRTVSWDPSGDTDCSSTCWHSAPRSAAQRGSGKAARRQASEQHISACWRGGGGGGGVVPRRMYCHPLGIIVTCGGGGAVGHVSGAGGGGRGQL